MKISLNNKNTFLFVILLILIFSIVAVSVYNFLTKKKEIVQDIIEEGVVVMGNYEVKEINEEIIIKNKSGKFSLLAPKGWIVENYGEKVTLLSSPFSFDQEIDILDNVKNNDACMFSIKITRYSNMGDQKITKVMDLMQLMDAVEEGEMEDPYYRTIFVDNKMALEVGSREEEEKYVFVELPFEDKIYSFTSGMTSSEKCMEAFSQVLGQVRVGGE